MDNISPFMIVIAISAAVVLGYGIFHYSRRRRTTELAEQELREKWLGHTPIKGEQRANSGPVCDMCSQPLDLAQAYFATTEQVVTRPAYWEFVFSAQWSYVHRMDPYGDSIGKLAQKQAAQPATWALCESCIQKIPIDREQARSYAIAGTHPIPGSGPTDTSRTAAAAAAAWKKLYGAFPASIQFE